MTDIQSIGAFFPMTPDGFLVNPTHVDHIPMHWQNVLEEVVNYYKKYLKQRLHSVYVRGSVATGRAVDGFSDLDTFALVHPMDKEETRWETATFQPIVEKLLKAKFDFVNDVEMQLATFQPATFFKKQNRLAMIIKTQSLCLYGESLAPQMKPFKPDRSVCLNYRWLEEDIDSFLHQEEKSISSIQVMLKVLIRTGFELVIEREGRYTTDLYLCYKTFSKYHPSKQTAMRMALFRYLNPDGNVPAIEGLVKDLGMWLVKSSKKYLG